MGILDLSSNRLELRPIAGAGADLLEWVTHVGDTGYYLHRVKLPEGRYSMTVVT